MLENSIKRDDHLISLLSTTAETSVNTTTLVTAVPTKHVPTSQADTTIAPSYQAPIGLTPRGSGIEHNQLPQRFRRKPIDDTEIEYIQASRNSMYVLYNTSLTLTK